MQLILFIRIIFINGSCKYCVFTMVTVVFQSIFLVQKGMSHTDKNYNLILFVYLC